jgi:GT2 family glycosyltransferase
MTSPQVACVLGMHRAGASVLAKALAAIGVELGDNLSGPNTNNSRGFFEDRDIYFLNEQLLSDIGHKWSSVSLINVEDLSSHKHRELFDRATRILRNRTSRFSLWGFKDPRTARLLPFWQQVFENLGLEVTYVISLRDPLSVARSLESRNNFPHSWSQIMWLQHYLASFSHTDGKTRLVVDYDLLVSNPEAQIRRIAGLLNITLDQGLDVKIKEYCEVFLDPNSRHNSISFEEKRKHSSPIPHLWEFYEWALAIAGDSIPPVAPDQLDPLKQVERDMRSFSGLLGLSDSLSDSLEAGKSELERLSDIVSRLQDFLGWPRGCVLLALRILPRWMQRLMRESREEGKAASFKDRQRRLTTRVCGYIRARLYSLTLDSRADYEQPQDQKNATREFSIVVPVHDAPEMTARCLLSLERYAPNAEIILVDDGSKLQETRDVINAFGTRNSWKIIRNTVAKGHSRACEGGARQATRKYICLLNSDTVVTPWSWTPIRDAFVLDSTIGVAGPATSWADSLQQIAIARESRHLWTDGQIYSFALRYISAQPPQAWEDLYPEYAVGFAFFIRRELWELLGGFDLGLPDYGNEFDLCMRGRQLGYRVVWVKNSYIHHFGRQSYSLLGRRELIKKFRYGRAMVEKWRSVL